MARVTKGRPPSTTYRTSGNGGTPRSHREGHIIHGRGHAEEAAKSEEHGKK